MDGQNDTSYKKALLLKKENIQWSRISWLQNTVKNCN